MRRLLAREDGSAATLIVLCMVVLIGFLGLVIDSGMLFYNRTQLQKAVDGAALAAAFDLPDRASSSPGDATTYLGSNGVTAGLDQTTIAYNGPSTTYATNDSWTVTARRQVPMTFAPIVGFAQGSVATTAKAVNSPLSAIDASHMLPYAIWGGNDPTAYAGDLNPPTLPPPDPFSRYQWPAILAQPTSPPPGPQITFRDNQWANTVVYPNPQTCGGHNQPDCNQNWQVGPNVGFKGFFNGLQGDQTVTTGWNPALWDSQGGNSVQPWSVICSILASHDKVAVMPVVIGAQQHSASGGSTTVSFNIRFFVGIRLDPASACGGGTDNGNPLTGELWGGWHISRGRGGGSDTGPGPVHVLQLWQ